MRALLATVLFVIFAFDIGFSIGGFLVTTNRFCLVILAVVLAVELFNQKKIKSWNVIISSSFPLFIALICLISFLFNYSQEGIFIILSWFLIAFVVFAYGIILDRLSKPELETIITVSPVLGLMILLVVLFIISQNMGINAVLGMPVRHWFKYHMPGGLSRFMNGLLVLTLLPFLYYLKQRKGEMKTSKLYKIGTITLFTLSVLLTIVVGSRQTLLAIFVGLSIYFALYSKTKFYNIATLGCVLLVLYLFASVLFGEAGFLWLEERFLAKTMSDIETGSERKFLYLDALKVIMDMPFWGYGPGNAVKVLGIYPHNGYLGLFIETGLVLSVPTLVAFYSFIGYNYLKIPRDRKNSSLLIATTITFLAYATVSLNFNDLLKDYLFWVLFTLNIRIITLEQKL